MNSHRRLPERYQDGGKKVPEAAPMFRGLFNSPLSLNIHNQALLTIFIKGMAQGILPLDQYRAFQAQDAVYFQKGLPCMVTLHKKCWNERISFFFLFLLYSVYKVFETSQIFR